MRHAPLGVLRTASFWLGRELVDVPLERVTNSYGFSFAAEGWNYFKDLVAERERQPDLPMEESTFFRFFQTGPVQAIRYLNDVLFMHDPERRAASDSSRFYLGTYPWGEWDLYDAKTGGVPWGHHYDLVEGKQTRDMEGYRRQPWYKPGDPYPLAIEWDQTFAVHRSIRSGYRPALYGTYPEIVVLERNDGDFRAVIANGQHRVASLSHLGRKSVRFLNRRNSLRVIREADVQSWYYVQNGFCSKATALMFFDAFFELNGRERATFLGLETAY